MLRSSAILVIPIAFLVGCAQAPRSEALKLAESGKAATGASATSMRELSSDVGLIVERNMVRFSVASCPTQCAPRAVTDPIVAAAEKDRKLANVVLLRAKAFQALGQAYDAFAAEARFEARQQTEAAISNLFTQVNGLGVALAAAGQSPLAALSLVGPLAQKAGGVFAEQQQATRLKSASVKIRLANEQLKVALSEEKAIYTGVRADLEANKRNVVDALLAAGVADPVPPLKEFNASLGLGTPEKPPLPAAFALARTRSNYRTWALGQSAEGVYAANIEAMDKLIAEHRAFEDGQPLSLDDLAFAIDELTAWATIVGDLRAASGTASSQQGGAP